MFHIDHQLRGVRIPSTEDPTQRLVLPLPGFWGIKLLCRLQYSISKHQFCLQSEREIENFHQNIHAKQKNRSILI